MSKAQAAIVGAAETTRIGVVPDMSQLQLHADAAINALETLQPRRPLLRSLLCGTTLQAQAELVSEPMPAGFLVQRA